MNVALALDRSLRSIDADGHMKVEHSVISRACVSPYKGEEIISGAINGATLNLDPNRIYRLLRSPAELARAADSFTGKPLLLRHTPISADQPAKESWAGTVGTVTFEDGV